MSTREIILDGGSPWGFRMHGGADVGQPLRISRVNPGSKAAQKGVREGDVISSINGQSTRNITNSDAHALLRNAGQTLHLGLNEECSGSPKRRLHRNIQESKSEAIKRSTVTKTTTTTSRNSTLSVNGATDPNCNNKISTKDDGRQGRQNGSLKDNTATSTPDSKATRRRRRQQNTNLPVPANDIKEDSDTIPEKSTLVPFEVGTGRTRRRRRSRGNRRKCRAVGVDSESGSEQKTVSQDEKEMSLTERETDSALSDIGGKSEENSASAVQESCQISCSTEIITELKSEVLHKTRKPKIMSSGKSGAAPTDSEVGTAEKANTTQICEVETVNRKSDTNVIENRLHSEVRTDSKITERAIDTKVSKRRRRMLEVEDDKTESTKEIKFEARTETSKEIKTENIRKRVEQKKVIKSVVVGGKSETIESTKIEDKTGIENEFGQEVGEKKTETEVIIKSEKGNSSTEIPEKNEVETSEYVPETRNEIKTKILDSRVEVEKEVRLKESDNTIEIRKDIKSESTNDIHESDEQNAIENIIVSENEEAIEKGNEAELKMVDDSRLIVEEVDVKVDLTTDSKSNFLEDKSEEKPKLIDREIYSDILIPETVAEINNEKCREDVYEKNESNIPIDDFQSKIKTETLHSVIDNRPMCAEEGVEVLNNHSTEVAESTLATQMEEDLVDTKSIIENENVHGDNYTPEKSDIENEREHESKICARTSSQNKIEKIKKERHDESVDNSEILIDNSVTGIEEVNDSKEYSGVKVVSVVTVESSCDKSIDSTCILTSDRKKPLEEVVEDIEEDVNKNKALAGDVSKGDKEGNDVICASENVIVDGFTSQSYISVKEEKKNLVLLNHDVKQEVSTIHSFKSENVSMEVDSVSENTKEKLDITRSEKTQEMGNEIEVQDFIPEDCNREILNLEIEMEESQQLAVDSKKSCKSQAEDKEVLETSEGEQEILVIKEVQHDENTFAETTGLNEIKIESEKENRGQISDDVIEYIVLVKHDVNIQEDISNSNDNKEEIIFNIEADGNAIILKNSSKTVEVSVKEQEIVECKAVMLETEADELWEEVEELGETEIFYDASDGLSEDMESGCLLSSNTTALLQDSSKLSDEDRELLDPHPVMEAEEEETLRKFLHGLNLADYSKEAVNARNAVVQDSSGKSVEEMYTTRKDKRRTVVDAYPPSYSQQRGLEVILEENSSDYSDGEKRGEEAHASKVDTRVKRKGIAWEEAVYIPETDEIVYLTRDSDEGDQESTGSEQSSNRSSGVFYSETSVVSDIQGVVEGSSYVYRRMNNESRRTRIISEEVSIDVFSEDMENALENALECEEVESEESRRDDGEDDDVKVELADTSDEEDHLEATWRRGKARERLDGVEIVYLDEDSGSTSSGMKVGEDGAEEVDVEEDPDLMYESDEFPVISKREAEYLLNKESSGGSSDSIYENVEFIDQKMTFLKKKELDIPSGYKNPVMGNDETSAIYENIVFFKRENESEVLLNTQEVSSTSTLREDNRNNLTHLPDNCNESVGKAPDFGGEINSSNVTLEEQNNENKKQTNYKTITDSNNTQLEPDVDANENKPTQENVSGFSNTRKADVTVSFPSNEGTTVASENRQHSSFSSSEGIKQENTEIGCIENNPNAVKTTITVDRKSHVTQEEKIETNTVDRRSEELIIRIEPEENSLIGEKEISDNILSVEAIENDAKDIKLDNNYVYTYNDIGELKQTQKSTLDVNDSDSDYRTPNITPEPSTVTDKVTSDIRHPRNEEEVFEELESITPTNRSRRGSSSSDAGSHGTAFYCPGGFSPVSSDADISSFAEDMESKTLRRRCSPLHFRKIMPRSRSHENISECKNSAISVRDLPARKSVDMAPKSLKEISVKKVLSMPYGGDILRILEISVTKNCDKQNIYTDLKDTVRRLQLLNFPPMSATYKYMGKPPLSGSLPDLSSVKLEKTLRGGGDHKQITDSSSNVVTLPSSTQPVQPPQSLAGSQWLGMPTKEDPNLYVCLSPSQIKSYHQGEDPTPEEAENLLDLHRKFIHRRGYHEAVPPPPPNRKFFGIRHCYNSTHVSNVQHSPSSPLENDKNVKQLATSANIIPSPRFRAVLTSLDSKIHCEGNTGEILGGSKEKRDGEAAEKGASTPAEEGSGFSRSRSSSRLLAILRAVSSDPDNNVEFQPPSSASSSAANSPPPLPPLPHAYQNQLEMLNLIHQQGKRPSTICCTTYDDFDYVLQNRPPQSPSSYSQKSDNSNLHSPSLKPKDGERAVNTTPSWSNKNGENRKERIQSWYGQEADVKLDKERLRVKSLSDWLQLVKCGGSNKDDDGTRSIDSTPPRSACLSTQSSPGPVRRAKEPSPKPETRINNTGTKGQNDLKEYQKLKQQIIERRFSLPDSQKEEIYLSQVEIIKAPAIPPSPREDERHEQQLRLLHQRQQQRLRNQQSTIKSQQMQEKRPPLPQPPKYSQPSAPSTEVKSHQGGNNIQQSQGQRFEEVLNNFQEESKSQQSQNQNFKDIISSLQEENSKQTQNQIIQELKNRRQGENKNRQPQDELELQNERKFDAEVYTISKKGDIAIINNSSTCVSTSSNFIQEEKMSKEVKLFQQLKSTSRPKSMPAPTEALVTGGEFFRQQMYNEYMHKVAERAERRRQKVIRLSSVPRDDAAGKQSDAAESAATALQLENEFMGRVRERMDKLGLNYDEESDDGGNVQGEGGGGEGAELPKHLQEFLVIAGGAGTESEVNSDVDGVWSPSQKSSIDPSADPNNRDTEQDRTREGDDAPPAVWTPKSAGASPTSERKEFRPVNFESPKLHRKNRSANSTPTPTKPDSFQQSTITPSSVQESTTTTFSSVFPPWQPLSSLQQQHSRDDSTVSVGSTIQSPTSEKSVASSTISTSIDRRLVQSQSAPASGLSALASSGSSNIKLPRAQNPTITLLQKAREGQLPRGALYLDHKMNSKEVDKPYVSPNEILYSVKKEYESDGEQRKKMVDLGPRKFEGIGPTTKEGIPIVLRSEVKDTNQAKWYKRMYDSLHRAGKDDDYVTIRYKPRRGHYPYTAPGGYLSEPEPACYDSDIGYSAKYATLDRRRIKNKENDFTTSTLPRSRYVPHPASIKYATEVYKNQPGRIEDYEPGHSSISEKETKQWWDEVLDIFDGQASAEPQTTPSTPSNKPFMAYALKESGYESDSTLVFKRRDENQCQLSPAEQKLAYKTIQKGGEVPLHGLRKAAPERPKEPVYGPVPPRSYSPRERATPESPHRYVESEVTIHYRSPVRSEAKEALSEEELARRQAEAMRRIYQEERRRKYLQELQDMHSRRHTDNFTPSQKSPIPLNRYDDFLDDVGNKGKSRDRTPEPKLVARALYNFVGQTSRELSFRRGDIIFVRRQIDKNWYEGEHNAMVGLFPFNYVEIIPYDGIRTIPKRPSEGQARAKFNFIAQTHLELSLVKGELVVLTRRVDDNWFEGRIGNRKGIFPVSYVEILSEPGEKPVTPIAPSTKPITLPASHTVLMNGSGIKQSMGQHSYQPTSFFGTNKMSSAYTSSNPYATLPRQSQSLKQPLAPVNQTLHIDTHSEPVPYRALYNYRPQNEDELELCEGDTVYVMEKCDDGWYVGSSQRTGYFGTFPGNYVERI